MPLFARCGVAIAAGVGLILLGGCRCSERVAPACAEHYTLAVDDPYREAHVGSSAHWTLTLDPAPVDGAELTWERQSMPDWIPLPVPGAKPGEYILTATFPAGSSKANLDSLLHATVDKSPSNSVRIAATVLATSRDLNLPPGELGKPTQGRRDLIIPFEGKSLPRAHPSLTPEFLIWVDTEELGPPHNGYATDFVFVFPAGREAKQELATGRKVSMRAVCDSGEYRVYSGEAEYGILRSSSEVRVSIRPRRSNETYSIWRACLIIR